MAGTSSNPVSWALTPSWPPPAVAVVATTPATEARATSAAIWIRRWVLMAGGTRPGWPGSETPEPGASARVGKEAGDQAGNLARALEVCRVPRVGHERGPAERRRIGHPAGGGRVALVARARDGEQQQLVPARLHHPLSGRAKQQCQVAGGMAQTAGALRLHERVRLVGEERLA